MVMVCLLRVIHRGSPLLRNRAEQMAADRPPEAERIPYSREVHGVTLEDPYHWLKDPGYPEVTDQRVLAYLEAENDWFDLKMAPYQNLIGSLFEELKARQPEADESVPYREGDYLYRWRFEHGAQYRLWERASVAEPEKWRLLLDEPSLAEGRDYFSLGGLSVSRDGRYLAWSVDVDGSERYTLSITDLTTGTLIDEPIGNTLEAPVWAADSRHFFYLELSDNWRPYRVRLHRLGTPRADDPIVYQEQDESFFVHLEETHSEEFILITAGDHVTSEARIIPAGEPHAKPRLIAGRRPGHEYHLDHREGRFYIRSNDTHKNFRLAVADENAPEESQWQTLIEGSDDCYLTGHLCLKHHLIVAERIDGLDQIRVIKDPEGTTPDSHLVAFPEPSYAVSFGSNAEYDPKHHRIGYESMVTPFTVYDYDLS